MAAVAHLHSRLYFTPDVRPNILGLGLGQLPKKFSRSFIVDIRATQHYFHNFVTARVLTRVEDSFVTQSELLPVLRTLRNFQDGTAIDGRHFDFGSQASFTDRERQLDFDVIPIALEERVLVNAYGDVQVARRTDAYAYVPFTRNPQSCTGTDSLGYAHFHHVRPCYPAFSAAGGTCVFQTPCSAAALTLQIKLHGPGHLRYGSSAVALGANRDLVPGGTAAMTRLTNLLA